MEPGLSAIAGHWPSTPAFAAGANDSSAISAQPHAMNQVILPGRVEASMLPAYLTEASYQRFGPPDIIGQVASGSEQVDERIDALGDWRGELLSQIRSLIKEADPDVVEEVKWAKASSPGVPVWSHDGMICTGESYKDKVKLTFAKGASLEDPSGLFNSSLEGKARRAIDFAEGDAPDEQAFKDLIRSAVSLNQS
jgi:hypothetical protein